MSKAVQRIIVLGPLRSGTSLTAELVRRWGAYAGRDADLWQTRPDDPRGYGYMEYIPLQELNDDLLDGNDRVPPPDEALTAKVSDPKYRKRALDLLQSMDESAHVWVWKDARLPLTLPFWMNVWDDPLFIVTVRHPAETILSAARTEGMEDENLPFSAGLIYWQFCMLNILIHTQNSRRKIFIAYDQLMESPLQECARLSRFLDSAGPTERDTNKEESESKIEIMASHVSKGQRHYRYEKSLSEMPQATREQRALYDFLRVKTIHPDEAFKVHDFALYPGWREYLQAMGTLLAMSKQMQI